MLGATIFATMPLWPATKAAETAQCRAPEKRPVISFRKKTGPLVFDTSHSRQQLRQLKGARGDSSISNGWIPTGWTLTELKLAMNVRVDATPDGQGRFCSSLFSVKAKLGYDKLTVFVAREYGRGSCQYLSVIKHEQQHVAIFRDTLDRFMPRFEARLRRAAERHTPVRTRTPKQGAARLKRSLDRQLQPLFREINKTLDRANSRIDTKANYEREQTNCPTW